jgi:hypothetical protein
MANRDLVAIGTSAGGVEALSFLCRALPAQFPATILITLHLPSQYASTLDPGRVKIARQARTVRVATTPSVDHELLIVNSAESTSWQPQRRPEASDRR